MNARIKNHALVYGAQTDPVLQASLEQLDAQLRNRYELESEQRATGLLDLQTRRLAMIRPDHCEYAASVPKIGILLAYFAIRPEAATTIDAQTRYELGLMIKASSDEIAAKFSHELGLKKIQDVLNTWGFYDAEQGGGIWVGKHYGETVERYADPVGDHSHAATVRQLLRFFLLLEREQLVSPTASRVMREIFDSPGIPHDQIKFVKGLAGRDLDIIRKWGSWEDWLHDAAVVKGHGKHYILVALTHHPRGNDYLEGLASGVDDLLSAV
jgi:beta-lactamase class A